MNPSHLAHSLPIPPDPNETSATPVLDIIFLLHQCTGFLHSSVLQGSPPSIYLTENISDGKMDRTHKNDRLCITLPRASRTAWDVKFSDGIRLMKCFWRFFSYDGLVFTNVFIHTDRAYPLQYVKDGGICVFKGRRKQLQGIYQQFWKLEEQKQKRTSHILLTIGTGGRDAPPSLPAKYCKQFASTLD